MKSENITILSKEELNEQIADAIATNNISEMFRLANGLGSGKFGNIDNLGAKELYEKLVDREHTGAMFNLAVMHHQGQFSGSPELDKAKELYEKLVDREHTGAMFNLALMYHLGHLSGSPELEKAKELYEKAIVLNHTSSMFNLALIYRRGLFSGSPELEKAKELYEKAIALNEVDSMVNLAWMYEKGLFSGSPELEKAKELYEKAIALNDSDAMFFLALLFRNNKNQKQNEKIRMCQLFQSAADLGHKRAECFLPNILIKNVEEKLKYLGVPEQKISKIASCLESLEEVFFKIREGHLFKESKKLAHFTNFSAIESILSKDKDNKKRNCLRLYHVDYMNDPFEGRRLLDFKDTSISKDKVAEKRERISQSLNELFKEYYYDVFDQQDSTASLLPSVFTVSLTNESDRLDLWRAYGNDGQGYCLVTKIDCEKNDFVIQGRNRKVSMAFHDGSISQAEIEPVEASAPVLYQIRYQDSEVGETLDKLASPLNAILKFRNTEAEAWPHIATCVTAILIELLFLYKDEQYATEKEARALAVMRLNDPRILPDERTPGHLYCNTSNFLFETPGSEIILGPKVAKPAAAIWNIRFRLNQMGLANTTVVKKSKVPYR